MVLVNLTAALICFLGQCYPALVGTTTPTGYFQLQLRLTQQFGYGGDVLQFFETEQKVFAIHRVWTGNQAQQRLYRLQDNSTLSRHITNGCINIKNDVYEKLVKCCSNSILIIKQ